MLNRSKANGSYPVNNAQRKYDKRKKNCGAKLRQRRAKCENRHFNLVQYDSPWQRGLNENTNDILRFFFPKGTDFSLVSEEELLRVVHLINTRPRKCLDYLSPLDFISKKCCT